MNMHIASRLQDSIASDQRINLRTDTHSDHDHRIKKIELTVDKTYCVMLLRFTWDSIVFFNKACRSIDYDNRKY